MCKALSCFAEWRDARDAETCLLVKICSPARRTLYLRACLSQFSFVLFSARSHESLLLRNLTPLPAEPPRYSGPGGAHRQPRTLPGQPRCLAGFVCLQWQARDIWQAVDENFLLDKINRASCAIAIAASLRGIRDTGAVQVGVWLFKVWLFLTGCPQAASQSASRDLPVPLEGLPGKSLGVPASFPCCSQHAGLGKAHGGSTVSTSHGSRLHQDFAFCSLCCRQTPPTAEWYLPQQYWRLHRINRCSN